MTAHQRWQERIRVKPGEQRYATRSGRTTLAVRSLEECAAILGISRQAAHQLERSAFHKIRMRLLPLLEELNPELYEQILLAAKGDGERQKDWKQNSQTGAGISRSRAGEVVAN